MSKLSKEQIKALSAESYIYSGLKLMCDGYAISLQERLYKRKLRVVLYVNGQLKGGWILDPELHPESKFYMPNVRYVKNSPRSKKTKKVEIGVQRVDFASIGQALRHLNKVCDSVEVIEDKPSASVDFATQQHCEDLVSSVLGDDQ